MKSAVLKELLFVRDILWNMLILFFGLEINEEIDSTLVPAPAR